jgi:polysaccharide biosynthesis protein PslF
VKVLIASGAYPPIAFGEATCTYHLATRLARAGHHVHVLTRTIDAPREPNGFILHPVMKDWTWKRVPQLRRLLREVRPDAILQMHLGANYDVHPMMTFFPTIAKKALPEVRHVTWFSNPYSQAEPDRMPFCSRMYHRLYANRCARGRGRVHRRSGTLLRDSDAVIALCRYHLNMLISQDPLVERIAIVVPPPANVEVIPDTDGSLRASGRRRVDAGPGCFVLGFLGYVYEEKNIETLLHAMAQLRERMLPVRLVVMGGPVAPCWPGDRRGSTYFESLQRLAHTLGLQHEIVWTGSFVAGSEVAELIHGVDAFVLPFDDGAHLNNSSIATLASYGAAIVTTRKEHTDPQFVNGENVLLCPPYDPIAVRAAIEKLMTDEATSQAVRSGARQLAEKWFSWDRAMELTMAALGADATEPRPAGRGSGRIDTQVAMSSR